MVLVCSEDFATQGPRAESWGPRDLMAQRTVCLRMVWDHTGAQSMVMVCPEYLENQGLLAGGPMDLTA